jgi:uncharacterized protein (DUF1015 family)
MLYALCMADFRPFRALRYDTTVAGKAEALIAPPYDVVSPEQIAALHARSPYNVSRVDYGDSREGDTDADNRYTRSKQELDAWLRAGVLKVDSEPYIYAYDQEFEVHGERRTRRSLFGRLRVEEWDKGIILPHEHTRPRDKADRYHLLEATRVNLSPILPMYHGQSLGLTLTGADIEAPVLDAALPNERHTLSPLTSEAAARVTSALADARLYIADGHHRYEVALAYRNERRAAASAWTGDEPENYVLAALVDADDPGLVVLPIHRLLKLPAGRKGLAGLDSLFEIKEWSGHDNLALASLMQAVAAAGTRGQAFGLIGFEPGKLHLATVKDTAAVTALLPAARPPQWKALDVAVLHNALLPAVGFVETPDTVAFTEDHAEAAHAVASGAWDAAVLLNPTRVDQIIDVAEAGERMPQKSTFFYPKLGTGIVMLPLDEVETLLTR